MLSLELTASGFDFSVLSEFRGRLLAHGAECRLFDRLLEQFRERGWRKRARQATHRFDARAGRYSHAAPAGRWRGDDASRAGRSWQKLLPPGCWTTWTPSGPIGRRIAGVGFRLPKEAKARVALAETIGADGRRLLESVYAETSLPWLAELEAIQTALAGVDSALACARARHGLAR